MTSDAPAQPVTRPIALAAAVVKPAKPKTQKAKAGVKSAGKKSSATKKPAGGKPAAKDVNKSAEIRKVAAAMKARNQKPRPSLIMAELKKQGVVVSSPQVSMVLKKMGFRPLRKRKKAAAASLGNGATSRVAVKSTSKATAVSLEDLLAAKKMAGNLGGTNKAIAALQALKRFEG
jgi:transposase